MVPASASRVSTLLLPVGLVLLCSSLSLATQAVEPAAPPTDVTVEPNEPVPSSADPAEQADDSPFDYRASEQISEDLSVSFPVDI